MKNFEFKIRLDDIDSVQGENNDIKTEVLRQNISSLLNLIVLTYRGEDIRADGFRFIGSKCINNIYGPSKRNSPEV